MLQKTWVTLIVEFVLPIACCRQDPISTIKDLKVVATTKELSKQKYVLQIKRFAEKTPFCLIKTDASNDSSKLVSSLWSSVHVVCAYSIHLTYSKCRSQTWRKTINMINASKSSIFRWSMPRYCSVCLISSNGSQHVKLLLQCITGLIDRTMCMPSPLLMSVLFGCPTEWRQLRNHPLHSLLCASPSTPGHHRGVCTTSPMGQTWTLTGTPQQDLDILHITIHTSRYNKYCDMQIYVKWHERLSPNISE